MMRSNAEQIMTLLRGPQTTRSASVLSKLWMRSSKCRGQFMDCLVSTLCTLRQEHSVDCLLCNPGIHACAGQSIDWPDPQ